MVLGAAPPLQRCLPALPPKGPSPLLTAPSEVAARSPQPSDAGQAPGGSPSWSWRVWTTNEITAQASKSGGGRGGGGGARAFLQCQKNSLPIGHTGMKYCMPQMCSLFCLVLKYAATSPNSSCQAPQDDVT